MNPARVSPKLLLSLYGVIPVLSVFIAWDTGLNHSRISQQLPDDPHALRWFTVFFMLPHIVASGLTFFDRSYWKHYRRRLVGAVVVITSVVWLIPKTLGLKFLLLAIAIYTVYHFIGQQTGISSMLARDRSKAYHVWRWLTLLAFCILYLAILSKTTLIRQYGAPWAAGYLLLYAFSTFVYVRRAQNMVGKAYIVCTAIMIVFGYMMYRWNLSFYMLLVPRIVHDGTAYIFYIQHNQNRRFSGPLTYAARFREALRLPEVVFTPVVSVALAFVLAEATLPIRQTAVAFFACFHYYTEGFMWKSGSPHRDHIHL